MDPVVATFKDQVLYLKHNLNAKAMSCSGGPLGKDRPTIDKAMLARFFKKTQKKAVRNVVLDHGVRLVQLRGERLLDEHVQAALRRLFGETLAPVAPLTLLIRAVAGGLLTAGVLAIVSKVGSARSAARPPRRKV